MLLTYCIHLHESARTSWRVAFASPFTEGKQYTSRCPNKYDGLNHHRERLWWLRVLQKVLHRPPPLLPLRLPPLFPAAWPGCPCADSTPLRLLIARDHSWECFWTYQEAEVQPSLRFEEWSACSKRRRSQQHSVSPLTDGSLVAEDPELVWLVVVWCALASLESALATYLPSRQDWSIKMAQPLGSVSWSFSFLCDIILVLINVFNGIY